MPEDKQPRPQARAFWSGTISFGLVSIPVDLLTATRGRRTSMHWLGPDGHPLGRQYRCPADHKAVGADEMVRGYELDDGHLVTVSDEELQALAPEKTRDISLQRFVPREQLSPRFFDRSYFLLPAEGAAKPYHLLAQTMEKSGRAGIATFVMRGKEQLVAILAEDGILRAETLRFADELRSPEQIGLPERPDERDVDSKRVAKFAKAIAKLEKPRLDVEELRRDHDQALLDMVERKRKQGLDVVRAGPGAEPGDEDEVPGEVMDVMRLLKERLGAPAAQRKRH